MTATVVVILALAGAFLCFSGYSLRRIVPTIIGLGFGFSLGVYIKLFIKVGKFGLQSADLAFSMFGDNIVDAIMKAPDEAYDILFKLLGSDWLWLPILCAVVCAVLGAFFYRTTAAVSTAFSAAVLMNEWFTGPGSSGGRAWMIIGALIVFVLVLLVYDVTVIGVSAAYGSFLLSIALRRLMGFSDNLTTIVLVLLFLAGCFIQGVQLFRTKGKA